MRTIIALLLMIVLSQPVFAYESWPSNEIKITCPGLVREILDSRTVGYYGCGTAADQNPNPNQNSEKIGYELVRWTLIETHLDLIKSVISWKKDNLDPNFEPTANYKTEKERAFGNLFRSLQEKLRYAEPEEKLEALDYLANLPPRQEILEMEAEIMRMIYFGDLNIRGKEAFFMRALEIAEIMDPVEEYDEEGNLRNYYLAPHAGFSDPLISSLFSMFQRAKWETRDNSEFAQKINPDRLLRKLQEKGLHVGQ